MNIYPVSKEVNLQINEIKEMFENGDIDQETMQDTMEAIKTPLEQKCLAAAAYIKNLDALIDGFKQAEKDINARRKKAEKFRDRLKSDMKTHMELNDINHLHNEYIDAKIKKNPETVELITSLDLVPNEYVNKKVERSLNKSKVEQGLKDNKDINFARLVRATRLDIK